MLEPNLVKISKAYFTNSGFNDHHVYAEGLMALLNQLLVFFEETFNAFILNYGTKRPVNYNINELDSLLFTLGSMIYKTTTIEKSPGRSEIFCADSFKLNFYNAWWSRAVKAPNNTEFAKNYLKELPFEYHLKMMKKYVAEIIDIHRETFILHYNMLRNTAKTMSKKRYEFFIDNEEINFQKAWTDTTTKQVYNWETIENKDLILMQKYFDTLLNLNKVFFI